MKPSIIKGMASIKRYRYRAYPTKGQAHALSCLYGCCRFVYNRFVAVRETMFKVGGQDAHVHPVGEGPDAVEE